ncbi:MAG: exodeoxyribonuclease VII large subunit [Magnetococcales bacterium]|nr:exodeoxyribonuclease VII large subunit [Magnetococcales bacterium]
MIDFGDCLTVTRLNEAIRDMVENGFPYLQVRGEVADWKVHPSGHIYFVLMDAGSRIRAVIWRGNRLRIPNLPKGGEAVVVTGRIALYVPRGEYQLIVEGLRLEGAGGERERMLALHAKLGAEGLFDPARKRRLPMLPAAVGVVTSASGAAIHDITRTLERRFTNFHLILAHARVQGEGAAEEIVRALTLLIRDGRAEVILCGRGGGSAEDLSAFNHESVVRAIATSPIPVISAIGHEIDVTLADLAADARASTPSVAAELAMPEKAVLLARLDALRARLLRVATVGLTRRAERLKVSQGRLLHPGRRIEHARLRCDELEQRLHLAVRALLQRRRQTALHLTTRLNGWPANRQLALHAARLERAQGRLTDLVNTRLASQWEKLRLLQVRLEAISPVQVLARGYALVWDDQGRILRSPTLTHPGATLRVRLAEGEMSVTVTEIA